MSTLTSLSTTGKYIVKGKGPLFLPHPLLSSQIVSEEGACIRQVENKRNKGGSLFEVALANDPSTWEAKVGGLL